MTLKTPLLCCFMLCASFHFHQWTLTGVTLRKRPIWVKIDYFFSHVTLKFDRWLWKEVGHIFNATSNFVHRFVAIGEIKLESQSGIEQFGSKLSIFFSSVTLKLDGWHWKTIGHPFYVASSFVHHFISIGELKLELQSRNAEFGVKVDDF